MTKTNERRGEYTLNIDGKDVNLLFSMNFWFLLEKNGIKLEEIETKLDPTKGILSMLDSLTVLIMSAGQSYAKKHKTEFDYEKEDIIEWFSEHINDEILKDILSIMMQTTVFGNKINQGITRNVPGKKTPSKK